MGSGVLSSLLFGGVVYVREIQLGKEKKHGGSVVKFQLHFLPCCGVLGTVLSVLQAS